MKTRIAIIDRSHGKEGDILHIDCPQKNRVVPERAIWEGEYAIAKWERAEIYEVLYRASGRKRWEVLRFETRYIGKPEWNRYPANNYMIEK
jgi:hypothetical protein